MPRTAVRKPLRLVLIGVPVAAAVGALALPALASQHGTRGQGLAHPTVPAAFASPRPGTAAASPAASPASPAASPASPAASPASPTASPASPTASPASPLDAYFDAGYGYSDAVLLARMWGHGTTPGAAKMRAGETLRAGRELPFPPGRTAATVDDGVAVEAFRLNGFDYDDAARIAKAWHTVAIRHDLVHVKAAMGRNILAGRRVTVRPAGLPDPAKLLRSYRHAGYDSDDAVLLARLWDLDTPYTAKMAAGHDLAHHVRVPVRPGDTPWRVSEDVAAEAYFTRGYGYDDAVRLARLWHLDGDSIGDAKVLAGRKILAGVTLPTRP